MLKPQKHRIYLASSWRNEAQPDVVEALRDMGHEVYDFRNPPNDSGFGWEQLDAGDQRNDDGSVTFEGWEKMLADPIAKAGFKADFDAMKWATAFVLLLPSGRSAHLEAGWAIGRGIPTAILSLEEAIEPELMALLADFRTDDPFKLLRWLERVDSDPAGDGEAER